MYISTTWTRSGSCYVWQIMSHKLRACPLFFKHSGLVFFMSVETVCGKISNVTTFYCFKRFTTRVFAFYAAKRYHGTLQRSRTCPVMLDKFSKYDRLKCFKFLYVSWNSFLKPPKCLLTLYIFFAKFNNKNWEKFCM